MIPATTAYCPSRFNSVRRKARVVYIGSVPIGGEHPIAVQSMTTTPTLDVAATVNQCIQLAEAGCDVIRITAQNVKAAEALAPIRKQFSAAGFGAVPLVADIHFLPQAAMTAVQFVEKVRINPGNYADKKKFKVKAYSDAEYDAEIERLHEAFSPIVLRCKELGKAMRIGTNHGSLSDRILNRYGDTPHGMCESAMEFLRIAESHGFFDIVLSMKASNPKVMIQAYRLMVAMMEAEHMFYPLHLGVTEAGDGDDARIKSAIGIGSLLLDGLGDTIRVSLTEDPVHEVPVGRDLVNKITRIRANQPVRSDPDPVNPFSFTRRTFVPTAFGPDCKLDKLEPPRVIHKAAPISDTTDVDQWLDALRTLQSAQQDARCEALLLSANATSIHLPTSFRDRIATAVDCVVHDTDKLSPQALGALDHLSRPHDFWLRTFISAADWQAFAKACLNAGVHPVLAISPAALAACPPQTFAADAAPALVTLDHSDLPQGVHPVGAWRQLIEVLDATGLHAPAWLRHTALLRLHPNHDGFGDHLLDAAIFAGALLCDGIGDALSIESVDNPRQALTLAFNILQGARTRSTKTEYVACPSCGRTLFDLQSTTQRIRAATGHLKGVTIAVMGCIVNGPGEMADADFGYVGGAPGKVNLYVGKECVQFHIPADAAVDALIALIKKHGKWTPPPA